MAGIKSLAVRGIRSFGPEDNDEQRISFERPLTLILGQNGCGKTTIIECVRYALTGQMPPGSRNDCFVHDAKVNRSTEVLGQVKLKIVNAKDEQLEIARSMKVTALQKKKSKFQTLDSFLSVIDEKGKTKDISSRCADLDSMMYEQLGVSKAIMNSVIFCHQEDSSWPLDEGKKVKERFDEIFEADKYSDCFERLRKIRKEYETEIKVLEQKVANLTDKKENLDKKKLDVVNTESKISEAEIRVAELEQEIKPLAEKIKAIETLQKNLVTIETKREKIKTKLEHFTTQEQELKTAITTLFEGPQAELEKNISNYATTAKTKKEDLDNSYKQNNKFNIEEEKIANEKTSNEMKFKELILLESQNQDKIDKKNTMIANTAKLAEIEIEKIESNEDAEKVGEAIKEKIKSLQTELSEKKREADTEENKLQADVDTCRDALSRHKQKISNKESDIQNIKKEITKVEKGITDTNKSKVRLDFLEKKMNTAEEDYQEVLNELNPEECQKSINEDEALMEKSEQELEELNEKINQLQKQSAKLKERDMIEDSLKQKEKQMNVLKNKHRSVISDLLGTMPDKGYAMAINKLEYELRDEVDSVKKKLKEKHTNLTSLETERKHVRELLTERRNELTAAEDQMFKACGTQTYEATLSKLNTTVEKLQEEQNMLQSSMFIFTKYKNQLKDNSCCPLCNRGFDSDTEASDLISQLTTQVMNVPAKQEKVSEELQRTSAKRDDLLSMKSLNEKIKTLKEKDVPQLETRLKDVDTQIATLTEESEELSMTIMEPEQKLQNARQIQSDMPLLDRYTNEVTTATKDLEAIKAECSHMVIDINLDEATTKKNGLRQHITSLRSQIKQSQTKLNQHTKKLQTMAEKKNKLKEELLNVQKKVQELVNLQENLKQLESNREKALVELKELQDGTAPLEVDLKEKEKIKSECVKKNRAAIDVKNDYIVKIKNAFDKVKSIEMEIKQHKERNVQAEMDKIKEANERLMDKQKQIMVDRNTLTKKIDSLKDELAKQDIYKRNLEDNLKLRKAQTEIANSESELAALNEKLNGVNMDMIAEKEPLMTKHEDFFKEKLQTEGLLRGYKERLKQCKMELKKAVNEGIEKQYREKFYDLHVIKALEKDIKDYSVALEKCLMEFHKEKMENINLIIREMWRKIYRGNDIDYIEIKTEGSATADSDRRKYDYRVVQCKNGVEIDMRGRCSAGQKVLACLIIRLALAETFSTRFGILALDEPTTNLDQENVKSLCEALGEIVLERMAQKNFMFIIITHDREFIESLGSIDKVTHFYEVSRNEEGKSRIKKIRFT
ncbi:DNA repair protein RAD50 [Papilio xuthus]|uniref:DNA repair protein RAD50 n=1 Tax=Papilio xuthus TaxID=66420 RepID=A0A194PM06_PAPXU|nr:DNA repair protein RAD50 [Papilio xuthus]